MVCVAKCAYPTMLCVARCAYHGDFVAVNALMGCGANASARSREGLTAEEIACRRGQLLLDEIVASGTSTYSQRKEERVAHLRRKVPNYLRVVALLSGLPADEVQNQLEEAGGFERLAKVDAHFEAAALMKLARLQAQRRRLAHHYRDLSKLKGKEEWQYAQLQELRDGIQQLKEEEAVAAEGVEVARRDRLDAHRANVEKLVANLEHTLRLAEEDEDWETCRTLAADLMKMRQIASA